tara:strand:+ start:116 stop:565 length:450 start_codon:yes stop_codon:yes gene_type:complete
MKYPNITPHKGEIKKIVSVEISLPIDSYIDDEEIIVTTSDEEVIYLLIYKSELINPDAMTWDEWVQRIHSAIITIPELSEIDKLRADSFCTGLIRCRTTKTKHCSTKEKDIFRMQKKDFNESKDQKFKYSRKNEYLAITNKKEFYGENL